MFLKKELKKKFVKKIELYWYNASPRRGLALSMQIVNFLIEFLWALYCFLDFKERDLHCYNAVSPKGTCIVNAYCQFSQQACTNFMQIYLHSLISTHFFILKTNLHCLILPLLLGYPISLLTPKTAPPCPSKDLRGPAPGHPGVL